MISQEELIKQKKTFANKYRFKVEQEPSGVLGRMDTVILVNSQNKTTQNCAN